MPGKVGTARRDVRYQAAVVQDGYLLLLFCNAVERSGFWLLPGGGRELESEATCVEREVREETGLAVRVERLLYDIPSVPEDMYKRLRTYLCSVVYGDASPGVEPESEDPEEPIVGLAWLDLHQHEAWSPEVLGDAILYPQLQAIRTLLELPLSVQDQTDSRQAWVGAKARNGLALPISAMAD